MQSVKIHPDILVEGPKWGDTTFYAKWLLAATKANALWEKAIKDSSFEKQVETLKSFYLPDVSICATTLLSRLETDLACFVIPLVEWEAMGFAIMAEMGFFVLTGQRYQMVIPNRLTTGKVKKAALKLAQTEDERRCLYPEYLVVTMPYAEAEVWLRRLHKMDEHQRCADRLLLIETPSGTISANG